MKGLFLFLALAFVSGVHATDYLNVGDALYLDYYSDLEREGNGVEVVVTEKTGEFMGGIQTYRVREVLSGDVQNVRMEAPLNEDYGKGSGTSYDIPFEIRKSTQNHFYGRSRSQTSHLVTVGDTVSIFKETSNGLRLETGTLEVLYFKDIDSERPLYWYPNIHKLSILSNDQRITSSAQSLLADLAAVDAQNCVYVSTGAFLEESQNTFPLCVGSRTTVGTVQKLYRSLVMGSNNAYNLFALVGDETTELYRISGRLPFDVYPNP